MGLIWLSLRLRWRRGWLPSLGLALLIGVVGGFAVGAGSAARRVNNTYQMLLDEVGSPNLILIPTCQSADGTGCVGPPDDSTTAQFADEVEALDVVDHTRQVESILPYFVDRTGEPLLSEADDPTGCIDGDRSVGLLPLRTGGPDEQAMPFRLDGRLPAQGTGDIVLAHATAMRARLAIGDAVYLAGWCSGEGGITTLDSPIELEISGLATGPLDIEPPGEGIALEPAYVNRRIFDEMLAIDASPSRALAVWIDGDADPVAVDDALSDFDVLIDLDDRATGIEDALASDARQLWVLAGVAGVSGMLLLLGPLIAANLRATNRDRDTLVALGMSGDQLAVQGIAHVISLAVIGTGVAALLVTPASALMPRGFAASIVPDREVWFDPVLTSVGLLAVMLAVVAIGALPASRLGSARQARGRSSERLRLAISPRLRPSAHTGVLAAVGLPVGPRHTNPWPSLISLMVAGATCVASATYLSGLDRLHHDPSRVGWNWDALISFDPESADEVPSYLASLASTPGVAQVTAGSSYPPAILVEPGSGARIWPWSFDTGPKAITPTIVAGRAPLAPNELAVDDVLARRTGLTVGDVMSLRRPSLTAQLADEMRHWQGELGIHDVEFAPPRDVDVAITGLEITGTAVLPNERTQELGYVAFTLDGLIELMSPSKEEREAARAWLPADLPPPLQELADQFLARAGTEFDTPDVFVRLSDDRRSAIDVIPHAELADVRAPSDEQVLTILAGLNLSRSDSLPRALAIVVSVTSGLLLAALLVVSIRSRLREIAILRTLGLASPGVRLSLAAQATVTTIVPLLVAIPIGLAVGGWAWSNYARDLGVVGTPVTPWLLIGLVSLIAIVAANIVAIVTAPSLARRPIGVELRAR